MRDYYLLVNNQQVGPYTVGQLQHLLAEGQLTSESLAWYDGLPDWVQLGTILEDASVGSSAPIRGNSLVSSVSAATAVSTRPAASPTKASQTPVQPPNGEGQRLMRALSQLQSILVQGETLESWAVQRRLFALKHRRILIAATSGRFISIQRGLFGGFEMSDLRWQDLHTAHLRVGIFGVTISLHSSPQSDLAIQTQGSPRVLIYSGLRKEQAREIYRIAQAHDQAWREKRRVRDLEEMRARSGGIQFAAPALGQGAPQANDTVARLQQAKEMRDANLISDSEYEALKARIIGST